MPWDTSAGEQRYVAAGCSELCCWERTWGEDEEGKEEDDDEDAAAGLDDDAAAGLGGNAAAGLNEYCGEETGLLQSCQ